MNRQGPDDACVELAARAADQAVHALESYIRLDADLHGPYVVVELTVGVPLGPREGDVQKEVDRFVGTTPKLRSAPVRFQPSERRDDLFARVVPSAAAPQPASGHDAPQAAVLTRLLVLGMDRLRLPFHLVLAGRRVPMLRPAEEAAHLYGPESVRLTELTSLPTGHLLDLVADGDAVAVARTTERSEVTVWADGNELVADVPHRLRERSGALRFGRPGGRSGCVLDYQLLDPATGIAGGTHVGSGTPLSMTVQAGPRRVRLLVNPRAVGERIDSREFPVRHSTGDELRARLIRAEARTENGDERWYVKFYGCDTSQLAQSLREYLQAQSTTIDRVNGLSVQQRWTSVPVITPVHVAPAASQMGDGVNATRWEASAEEMVADVRDGPLGHLPDWFGDADTPRPDRYVVAVTPWRDPVVWTPTLTTPRLDELALLAPIAAAVDACLATGHLHGDIKPSNVCWQDGGYVLVDGDSVAPLDGSRGLRPTPKYTSTPLLAEYAVPAAERYTTPLPGRYRRNTGGFVLSEHDRFGFALVVLTALAGEGLTDYLLERVAGPRRVDTREGVRDALYSCWDQPWPSLVEVLSEPFDPQRRQAVWDAREWLDRIGRAAARDEAERPVPAQAVPTAVAPDVAELRRRVRNPDRRVLLPDRADAVRDELAAMLEDRARGAERTTALLCWAVPLVLGVLVLLGAVLGT